jgi:two-component system, LytTR family, response regulator
MQAPDVMQEPTMIRVLIADDEALAREGIRVRLKGEPDIEIVGEAGDGPEAAKRIAALKPDLVFLDIRMPGFDGFEVLRRSGPTHLPAVIFVTAYDRYALQAFEAHAIDYLLKPIASKRFAEALQWARHTLGREDALEATHQRTLNIIEPAKPATQSAGGYVQRLAVKDGRRFLLLRTEEIDWIEAASNYVEVHARGRSFLIRMTLNELNDSLDPAMFARIHRSTVVNLDRIQDIVLGGTGSFFIRLKDGSNLRLSRGYRDRILGMMQSGSDTDLSRRPS